MIFISGIHGVGKSFFCSEVKSRLRLNCYSASALISELKKESFAKDKLIADIESNQSYLLSAKARIDECERHYLLDGHFCLLDANGRVQRIGIETFETLSPQAIVLLTESPPVIVQRRKQRDGIEGCENDVALFQQEEIAYANEVATLLSIPIHVSKGASHIDEAVQFIQELIREV